MTIKHVEAIEDGVQVHKYLCSCDLCSTGRYVFTNPTPITHHATVTRIRRLGWRRVRTPEGSVTACKECAELEAKKAKLLIQSRTKGGKYGR